MDDGSVRSTHFPRLGRDPGPCAALFAPAGMLLVVIMGVLPLLLPSSSAGNVIQAPPGKVSHPLSADAARPLHFPQVDLPFAGSSPASAGEETVLAVPQYSIESRSQRVPASGGVVSRQGPSAIGVARTKSSAPRPPVVQDAAGATRTRLLWPTRGPITSPFGWRIHPIFGTREFHTGMDIGAQMGAPVVSAYPGVVRFVGWKDGYGRLVIIYHGSGLETAYSHLSAASVSLGERVEQGQLIGQVGSTGWSTGPHLLFEVYQNGQPRNPVGYLN